MTALGLSQVLWDERQALAGKPLHFAPAQSPVDPATEAAAAQPQQPEPQPGDILEIYQALNADDRWALCFSGGGIRSAAFALGILQSFAALRVTSKRQGENAVPALTQFDYLSTVSGGGYIGSWLSAWLFQERTQRALVAADAGEKGHATGSHRVVSALNRRYTENVDSAGQLRDHEEAEPISNLRRDTHYLAPSYSPISPDLWSDVAGVLRNLFLNWILLVPPMILLVLLTKVLNYAVIDAGKITDSHPAQWFKLVMVVASLCFVAALSFSAANRPARGRINAAQPLFLICDLMPFLVGAALLIFVLGSQFGLSTLTAVISATGFGFLEQLERESLAGAVLLRGAILGAALYFVCWWLAPLWSVVLGTPAHKPYGARLRDRWIDLGTWCVAGATFGVLIGAGLILRFQFDSTDPVAVAGFACVFGPPWIAAARIIADVIYISFAEFLSEVDAGLEYQARSSGIFTLAYLGWLIWFGLVLGSPPAARWIGAHLGGWVAPSLATAGGLSGLFSVLAGSSAKSKAVVKEVEGLRRYFGLNTMAAIAAAIFAVVMVSLLSIACDLAFTIKPYAPGSDHPAWTLVLTTVVVLAVLIGITSHVININRYSLHSIYRNRLVRTFLGASRHAIDRDKTKNAFTDFDSRDSPFLHELWEHRVAPRGDDWKPMHIVNAALNLVSSKNLAWQERMAAPFTFSPLHCGCGAAIFSDGAFRTTYATTDQPEPYGGRLGLTLGTAMAISGAAVSPNMGYNSSPGVAFLMALFNVRLGWWLANPRGDNQYYSYVKPRNALRPFFMEMFGLTSETERWVYLSDGGHFENLGLYEMVRRRCRVIVVSDAGCDPDYSFDDLGNALRKIWIDLGVRIDLHGLDRLKKRFKERPSPATEGPYWAIGDILYSEADGGNSKNGVLLYFKAGLHGTEQMGVLSYALSHSAFPHETTLNQFFTESQFESYRMLGYEIAERAFECGGGLALDISTRAEPTLTSIIERLRNRI
jgi:hypothetical protein